MKEIQAHVGEFQGIVRPSRFATDKYKFHHCSDNVDEIIRNLK